jgi:predicted transcriptional regulator
MTKSVPVSVRLPPQLNDDVTAIATALDRSKSWGEPDELPMPDCG